jgi:ornithine decarboxylase
MESEYVNITLDNSLLQKYNVKLYGSDKDTYDIINDFLEDNQSEKAFYIVDLGEIVNSYARWIQLLPSVKPYYAVKCNPNPVLLDALASLGANFDCASENEIKTIINITEDPSRIVFANPCKMSTQIRYARANDVDLMTFDCEEELYKIKTHHPNANLMLRIAVDDSNSICQFNSKFGCKLSDIDKIFNIIKDVELTLVGFSFHVGSGCKSANSYYLAIENMRTAYDKAIENDIYINYNKLNDKIYDYFAL